jgi:hypothetical protein
LALKIGFINGVELDYSDCSNASGGKVHKGWRTESSGTHAKNLCIH